MADPKSSPHFPVLKRAASFEQETWLLSASMYEHET